MSAENTVQKQIAYGNKKAGKTYGFDTTHDPSRIAQMWFQESNEGLVLFLVFYTQACRWSRCLGCNLPSKVSDTHVHFSHLMEQVDSVFADPAIQPRLKEIKKVIISNNGSVLDEDTFSSTALMYLIARLNQHVPAMSVLCMESRPEYVDWEELEFISRALAEGETPATLEIAIGFEAFDDHIRNDIFDKGLTLTAFESMSQKLAEYNFSLKCYFMQKPVPGMSDEEGIKDIHKAIQYLHNISITQDARINIHLNPTYVAYGTPMETAFNRGEYLPPRLEDVVCAALPAKDTNLSLFIGLSDEGLAIPEGSFLNSANRWMVDPMEKFNQTQDFTILEGLCSAIPKD